MNMKRKLLLAELIIGLIILTGGLFTYGLGVHEILPVPRPDLVVIGTTLIGTLLILMGCDLFGKRTKEMEIMEKDERNIAIANAAMASRFTVMTTLLSLVIFALIFSGYMNEVACFSIIGAIAAGQITFLVKLYYLEKHM